MESLEQKIKRVTAEAVELVEYDSVWVDWFRQERDHLRDVMPAGLIVNIEHFGSTSVPGLSAKPIVDMVVEVSDVDRAKAVFPNVLEPKGYDCFWRPTAGNDTPPWYTWCIRRDAAGVRTHHLHVGRPGFKARELAFRDLLRARPDIAAAYAALKRTLCQTHHGDRIAYTQAKTEFIQAAQEEWLRKNNNISS
jgi:GrpB-like predicted nucleotidyltransferase (UPF0157 family)